MPACRQNERLRLGADWRRLLLIVYLDWHRWWERRSSFQQTYRLIFFETVEKAGCKEETASSCACRLRLMEERRFDGGRERCISPVPVPGGHSAYQALQFTSQGELERLTLHLTACRPLRRALPLHRDDLSLRYQSIGSNIPHLPAARPAVRNATLQRSIWACTCRSVEPMSPCTPRRGRLNGGVPARW